MPITLKNRLQKDRLRKRRTNADLSSLTYSILMTLQKERERGRERERERERERSGHAGLPEVREEV
jgi:hypothetical protein